jgi:hypothetical protein
MRERILNRLLVTFDGVVMQTGKTTQIDPSNHRMKFMVEVHSKGHALPVFRISHSPFISPRNHTPPTVSIQEQFAVGIGPMGT